MLGEPETAIGKFLGEIAFILGALTITFTLTRITNKLLRKKFPPKRRAIISFVMVGLLLLIINSCNKSVVFDSLSMGIVAGFINTFIIYIPCLILWLIRDIRKARIPNIETNEGKYFVN